MTIPVSMLAVGLAGLVGLAGPSVCAPEAPTMSQDKIEPRLLDDLRAAAAAGEPDRPLPVLIVLVISSDASPPDLAQRERRLAKAIERFTAELARHGRRPPMKALALSSAIATELTRDEMQRVAEDPSVARLVSNRVDRVATPHPGAEPLNR